MKKSRYGARITDPSCHLFYVNTERSKSASIRSALHPGVGNSRTATTTGSPLHSAKVRKIIRHCEKCCSKLEDVLGNFGSEAQA